MKRFRFEDCSKTGYGFSIEKKAVLLSDHAPAAEKHGSFFSAWAETAQEPHFGRERFFWCPYRMGNAAGAAAAR